jgi:2-dehydropantoate 2-reductase
MNILIVGAGAIGGYVGARLALAGHSVTLVGRPPLAEAVAARGLRLIEPEAEFEIRDCRVVTSVAEACAPAQRFDLALLTVKTYGTHAAIDALHPHAGRVDRFLSLQNGLSGEGLLAEAFGAEKIVAGTILNPVSIREPGVIALEKRKGGIGLGAVTAARRADVAALAGEFCRAGFNVRAYAGYRAMKWSKLLLNLIGNATSAILDLSTPQVFADKRAFAVEIAALREALRVARADGIRFVGLPGYPTPLLVAALRFLPLALLQPLLTPLAASGRGRKMPSLHIDLAGGKRRSEIDELNGAVARAGARLGVPTPANALLVDTFKELLSGRVARSAWRGRADRLWGLYRERATRPSLPGS